MIRHQYNGESRAEGMVSIGERWPNGHKLRKSGGISRGFYYVYITSALLGSCRSVRFRDSLRDRAPSGTGGEGRSRPKVARSDCKRKTRSLGGNIGKCAFKQCGV